MEGKREQPRTIAIIGGGASGALTAYHLSKSEVDAKIVVIDPRPELGLGLAYSTPSLRHLLNVPAGKISGSLTQPKDFLRWLQRHFDPAATESTFAPRAAFGRYLQSLFAEAQNVEQLRTSVLDLILEESAYTLILENGAVIHAAYVVLATGNFDPAALPRIDPPVVSSGAYCHNAWLAHTYGNLHPESTVTLIGTGLTSVDVLLRLREQGYHGTIVAASRHAIFPNRHAPYTPAAAIAIPLTTKPNCLAYLRSLRAAIRRGTEWRAAIDSLRAATNDLWVALPVKEQRRFRRHLQRRWDVVRHRMAPPIADVMDAELTAGTLVVHEGHLVSIQAQGNGARVTLRGKDGEYSFDTSRVINCTGPSMNYGRVASPLLRGLLDRGLITAGPLGSGLNSTRNGALIDAEGKASKTLFNLGAGRLGTLLESIAIPEILEQAVKIAEVIGRQLADEQEVLSRTEVAA